MSKMIWSHYCLGSYERDGRIVLKRWPSSACSLCHFAKHPQVDLPGMTEEEFVKFKEYEEFKKECEEKDKVKKTP